MLLLEFGLFTPASNVFSFRVSMDWWWWAYPGDDERSGEVWTADEPQPPIGVAALSAQCHHERMQPPHGEGRGVRCTGASTRARCADGASSTGRRGVVRAKLASTQTLHPAPPPVGLHRLHVPLVKYHIQPCVAFDLFCFTETRGNGANRLSVAVIHEHHVCLLLILDRVRGRALHYGTRADLFCWDTN